MASLPTAGFDPGARSTPSSAKRFARATGSPAMVSSTSALSSCARAARSLWTRAQKGVSWLGPCAKRSGLGTAILICLLTGIKSLAWFHRAQSTLPGVVNRTAGLEVVAILLGWYVVVYLLFVTGS